VVVDSGTVLATCAVVTIVSGALVYMNKSNLKPFKVLISSNTKAMESIAEVVKNHSIELKDHDERIVKIETKHGIHHPSEAV
jgi:F420-0:gamma-glutamyl ligase